jgi:hypothetical protein
MKRWMILAASVLLAACSGPRVILTSSDPHSIQLLVQGARFVPLQDVEDKALRYCADHGLVSRRTRAEWVDDTSMTFRFECEDSRPPASEKLADQKAAEPPVALAKAPVVRPPADRKQAAWNQVNARSSGWLKCILDEAARMARTSSERPDIAAVAVVASCSQWEHDIHTVLRRAGEDDGEFQAALHRQIIEFATARIATVRAAS